MHIKFLSTYWRKMLVVLVKTISQRMSAKIWQSPESTKWKKIPCFILTKALFIKKIFVIKMISEWDKERNLADCLDLQPFITNLHKWIQAEHKGQINNWTPERSDLCLIFVTVLSNYFCLPHYPKKFKSNKFSCLGRFCEVALVKNFSVPSHNAD